MMQNPDLKKGKDIVRAANYLLNYLYAIEADDLVARSENDELVKEKILTSLRKFAVIENGELIKIVYFKEYSDLFKYLVDCKASGNVWARAINLYPVVKGIYFKEYVIPWAKEELDGMTEEEGLDFIERLKKDWNL
ncbi:MAG: hypothetical protein E7E99_02880 [Peptoniphilus lacydonensis]|nr:hypothetical protein [Peptoniphilus lacydonensis]